MDSSASDSYKFVYYNDILLHFGNGTSQIIRLTAKLDDDIFCVWIKPQVPITGSSLKKREGVQFLGTDIFLDNEKQPTVSMKRAVMMLLEFLKGSPRSVILLVHSKYLASNHLVQLFQKTNTLHLFFGVIAGFANTLPIFMKKYPRVPRMELFALPNLTQNLLGKQFAKPYYQTPYDVDILQELVTSKLSISDLMQNYKPYREVILREKKNLRRIDRAALRYSTANRH